MSRSFYLLGIRNSTRQ